MVLVMNDDNEDDVGEELMIVSFDFYIDTTSSYIKL